MPYGTPASNEAEGSWFFTAFLSSSSENGLNFTVTASNGSAANEADAIIQDVMDVLLARTDVDSVTGQKRYPTIEEITTT